jgi:GPH family glycoside/pentoside/hexuronide:cation symporter
MTKQRYNPDGSTAPPIATSICLGFGVGTVGVSIMLNGVTVYFPAYMSTVLGHDVAIAGYLLMVTKLYDAVADVFIGMLSDRTRSRWGRRRPYLLGGALLSAVSFVMIFSPPDFANEYIPLYMFIALIIYSTGYSLFAVPYMAMPSEMTESKYERSRLLSFRTVFVSIGQLLAMAGTAGIISWGGGGEFGYMLMGWTMGLVIGTAMLTSFLGTAKVPALEVSKEKPTLTLESLKLMAKNRPFMLIVGAKIFQFLAFASLATTGLLFKLNVLLIGYAGQMQLAIVQNITTAASMPFWLWMERWLGKRDAYLVAMATMAAGSLSWLTADSTITLWGIIWRGLLAGIGSGGMILLSISMFSDSLAHDRALTGVRREGLLASVISLIETGAFAIGVAAVGAYLSFANYVPTTGGQIIEQPDSAVNALYFCFAILPVIFFICNAVCISFYNIGGRYPQAPEPVVDMPEQKPAS